MFCRDKGRDGVANLAGPIGNAPRKDEPRFKRNSELFTLLARYVCAPAVLTTFPLRPTSRGRPPLPALLLSFVRASSGLLAVEPHSCACIVVCSLVCVWVAPASTMSTTRTQSAFILFPRCVLRALLPAMLCLVALLNCLLSPGHSHSLPYAVLVCASLPRPLPVLALKPHAGLASTGFRLNNASGFDCKFDRAGVDAEPSGHGARDSRLIRPHT